MLRLSNGFTALTKSHVQSVMLVMQFFARKDIQESLKTEIIEILRKHKKNNKDKATIASNFERDLTPKLINKLSFAFTSRALSSDEIQFWLNFPESYSIWKNAWENAS